MNSRPPVIAAKAKAPQVHGSVSFARSETRWPRLATPISRRSTIAIVPITVTRANTWSVSIVGNIHVDSAIVMPSEEYSICSQILVGSGYIKAPLDRRVGDPATAPHDHAPQDDEENRGSLDATADRLGRDRLAAQVPRKDDRD